MAKKAQSFRFPEEFLTTLRTWAFVTGKDQNELLQEAFKLYVDQQPEIKEKVEKVINAME